MGTTPDYVRSKFGPIKDKNLKNVVAHQIAQQFPRIGGERIQQLCAQMIFEVLEQHLKTTRIPVSRAGHLDGRSSRPSA